MEIDDGGGDGASHALTGLDKSLNHEQEGPRSCPRYGAGVPRRVPEREPGCSGDDDVEREERDGG